MGNKRRALRPGRITMSSPPLMTGLLGEHMVCADLRRQGYIAFPTSQDCAYDVVVDTRPHLWRIQVKTTRSSRRGHTEMPKWVFNLHRIRNQKYMPYDSGDYDVLALAAVDIQKIAYVLPMLDGASTVNIRSMDSPPSDLRGPRGIYFEDLSFETVLAELKSLGSAHQFVREWACRDPTVCQQGHLQVDENIYIRKDTGTKGCNECRKIRSRAWRERQKVQGGPNV